MEQARQDRGREQVEAWEGAVEEAGWVDTAWVREESVSVLRAAPGQNISWVSPVMTWNVQNAAQKWCGKVRPYTPLIAKDQ